MAKTTTLFACTECGATSPRWLGKCPACGKFNTMAEEIIYNKATANDKNTRTYGAAKAKQRKKLLKFCTAAAPHIIVD